MLLYYFPVLTQTVPIVPILNIGPLHFFLVLLFFLSLEHNSLPTINVCQFSPFLYRRLCHASPSTRAARRLPVVELLVFPFPAVLSQQDDKMVELQPSNELEAQTQSLRQTIERQLSRLAADKRTEISVFQELTKSQQQEIGSARDKYLEARLNLVKLAGAQKDLDAQTRQAQREKEK